MFVARLVHETNAGDEVEFAASGGEARDFHVWLLGGAP